MSKTKFVIIITLLCMVCHGVGVFSGYSIPREQELPTHVILNDWTNGKSVSYVAYPEIENDILVLNEATVTFVEDLKD